MSRNFNEWIKGFRDSIATWKYYTDFDKAFYNVEQIKVELNILNSLVGSANIEFDFKSIIKKYPEVLKVIPILIAKRESEIKITAANNNYKFNFKYPNYTIQEYTDFMKNTGLFDLLQNHIIHSLIDYVLGVEVGMDTHGRKNRTGDAMEDLIESYLVNLGLVKNQTYFKEMYRSEIEKRWGINLSSISNTGKTEKRFDFVVKIKNKVYAIETNFYGSNGSKLNETARSYKTLALESKDIDGFSFIWFTDGIGWHKARHNLEEAFDVMSDIYSINDLENGIMKEIFVD